jgi:hypothetical protein
MASMIAYISVMNMDVCSPNPLLSFLSIGRNENNGLEDNQKMSKDGILIKEWADFAIITPETTIKIRLCKLSLKTFVQREVGEPSRRSYTLTH